MSNDTFEIILLVGRPASGKSEIMDFLSHINTDDRRRHFHVSGLDVLDDFPMLWTWFEEDEILSHKLGMARLHTDADGYFASPGLWQLLVERLSLEYHKRLRDPAYHNRTTTLIEFSRGSEHGGYREAFLHLSEEILRQAALVYVRVSFAESLRKNRLRFNPDRPDSILEHGLSDEKLERLYGNDDWAELAHGENGFLEVNGHRMPYAVFENEDDVTTGKPDLLEARLETVLGRLWDLHIHP
jgi:energy-coupling factor transporter ATP-binding protein EcfA2